MKIKPLILLMLMGSFITCKSQVGGHNVREIEETRAILNSYFYAASKNSDVLFKNKILQNYESEHWSHLINPFHLGLVQNFNIKTDTDVVHFDTLFDGEIEFLQRSSRNFNIGKWTEILDNENIVGNSTSGISLSSPAFDRSFTYAVFYIEDRYSGSLIVFKKESDGWVYFASGIVWVS